jgi:hypothetical protein
MGKVKKVEKSRAEQLWDEYMALQLTPEEQDAAHAQAERDAAEARAAGVYAQALELAGTIRWSVSWQGIRDDEWF